MLSTKHKWIFVHIPRTGGSSISYAFCPVWRISAERFERHRYWFDQIGGAPDGKLQQHAKLADFGVNTDEYFKFCAVRNPWERCVSFASWHEKHGSPCDLVSAVESVEPAAYYDLEQMDYILRFESLGEDFRTLCRKLGLGNALPLGYLNASYHRHYRTYFSDSLRQRVADRFAEDIERFGYEF